MGSGHHFNSNHFSEVLELMYCGTRNHYVCMTNTCPSIVQLGTQFTTYKQAVYTFYIHPKTKLADGSCTETRANRNTQLDMCNGSWDARQQASSSLYTRC